MGKLNIKKLKNALCHGTQHGKAGIFARTTPSHPAMKCLCRLILLLILTSVAAVAAAQSQHPFTVTGKVVDERGAAVEAASVVVTAVADSAVVASGMTNGYGRFRLRVPSGGDCVVRVTFIGCEPLAVAVPSPDKRTVANAGTLTLKQDSELIGVAEVTGIAPAAVVKGDTVSYSAAAIRVHDGAVLEDLLKKIPGAEVDADGKVTINGKEISMIMIDGKEFFVNDPGIALKNLPADAVKEVKTYDRKSDMTRATGIEDGEVQNVLDVTIKEGMKKGWFGNVLAGGGTKKKYETNAMVNRFRGDMQFTVIGSANNTGAQGGRMVDNADIGAGGRSASGESRAQSVGANFSIDKKKVDVHVDLSYNRNNRELERRESKETFLVSGSTFDRRTSLSELTAGNLRGAFRIKWEIDTLTSLQFNQHVTYGSNDSEIFSDSHTLDFMLDTINSGLSLTDAGSSSYTLRGDMMFNRRLGKAGRNVTVRASYSINDSDGDELTTSDLFFFADDSLSSLRRLTGNGSRTTRWEVALTYSEPLWRDAFLRVGYRYSNLRSSSLREPIEDNSPAELRNAFENETYNGQSQHAIELSLQSNWHKLFYNVGLDLIPLETRTRVDRGVNAGLDHSQTKLTFQPRATFVLRFDNTRQLRFMYRGRSSTPSILDLQEVKDISDPMNLQFGNPNLKNSFHNMMSVGLTAYYPDRGSSLMLIASANNTVNGITQKTTFDPRTGVRTTRAENINGNWGSSLNLVFSSPLRNRKFTAGTTLSCSYSHRVGYSSMTEWGDAAVSISNNAVVSDELFASYRCDVFDASLAASFGTDLTRNNLNARNDRNTYNYGLRADVNVNLPWDIYFSTSARYVGRRGYSGGFDDDYVMWNAQLSKNFLKEKQATIRLKVYDILQSQNNTFRTMGYDYTLDTETNVVGSYVMVQFVYRFNTMGGARGGDAPGQPRRRGDRGMRGGMRIPMPPPMRI